ncbi:MAG: hypothetical protein ACLPZJ_15945, partial [Terriglobales bacterium]
EGGPVHTATIQIFEKSLWRLAKLHNLIEIGALALHQFESVRLVKIDRRDVDMAVGDHCVVQLNANG